MIAILYTLFLLSGAAALTYQVVWVRSLGLVFGGSHLAVATGLAVFMGGLALGSWLFGRRAERTVRLLRVYGLLELGIAAGAAASALLLRVYPALYGPLARLDERNALWLTALRVVFAIVALAVPTTLMGGTLPVLSRLVARGPRTLGRQLGALYGINTLGAVAGTLAAAFVLLPALGVSRTLWTAVTVNVTIGLAALLLPASRDGAAEPDRSAAPPAAAGEGVPPLAAGLVLWGIGLSGFCALGYEVLWTRVLSMVVGTSVYSFAIMLVAFLTGIALGGQAMAWLPRGFTGERAAWTRLLAAFGATQVAIAATALLATYALRGLPLHATRLQRLFATAGDEFAARQGASFVIALAFMVVPATCMGLAFPIAGAIHARRRGAVARAVGEVLAYNTIGAIAGAAGSGFVLVRLFGIERSLQLLVLLNLGLGLAALAGALGRTAGRRGVPLVAGTTLVAVLALAAAPADRARMWDRKFFAVFRNNDRPAFATAERIEDALANTDVLYYHEGINETISVIRPKRAAQAFVVNGRVEASTHAEDVQCQRTLGHLPMLMHDAPRSVFVLGLGTGMTLGATSIHPAVERLLLAEIEIGVLPAARTFGAYNHDVVDTPRLEIVHDDGRNFLRTTRERFDVITADPIHPWSGGAAYLYTSEYFRTAAERLAPGGVICQWLPIYEMRLEDLRSVVRTFSEHFAHTAIWLTYYDAEIVGSQEPLDLDERRLAARLADPAIAADLAAVDMGTARDFLGYFLMGDAGVRAFARGGVRNTDDNLWLEFSAPRSQGVGSLPGSNVRALAEYRESPVRYMRGARDDERDAWWARIDEAARLHDAAHALALRGGWETAEFESLLGRLRAAFPDYAPGRFLEARQRVAMAREPRPIAVERFAVTGQTGRAEVLEIAAVTMRVGEGRAALVFADNARREVYGERYVDAPEAELDARLAALAETVLAELREAYAREQRAAGAAPPGREAVAAALRAATESGLTR